MNLTKKRVQAAQVSQQVGKYKKTGKGNTLKREQELPNTQGHQL